jgi:hypothetical protein
LRLQLALAALCLLIAGCGGGAGATTAPGGSTTTAGTTSVSKAPDRSAPQSGEPARLVLSHCPAGHPACRTTKGRIVYIERVDPDGDGDAHFVIVDPQGISLPGITAIDVRKGLRPHPLPSIGDRVSAAGPVQTGSYGQSQIHALELHVAGRG